MLAKIRQDYNAIGIENAMVLSPLDVLYRPEDERETVRSLHNLSGDTNKKGDGVNHRLFKETFILSCTRLSELYPL